MEFSRGIKNTTLLSNPREAPAMAMFVYYSSFLYLYMLRLKSSTHDRDVPVPDIANGSISSQELIVRHEKPIVQTDSLPKPE